VAAVPGAITFTTVSAGVTDAIRRGSFSSGPAPAKPAPPGAPAPSGVAAGISGSVDISLAHDVPIDETLADSGGAKVTVTGGLHLGATASMAIDIGFFGYKADFDAGVSESFDATLTANYQGDWTKTVDLGEIGFGVYDFQIGPVPLIVQPKLRMSLESTGHVEGTAMAGIHQHFEASAGVTITPDGVTPRNSVDAPDPTVVGPTATAKATAKVTAVPEVVLQFEESAEVGLQLRPYLELDATVCRADLYAGADLAFDSDLEFLGHKLKEVVSDPVSLARVKLATLLLQNCAVWSGTLTYSETSTSYNDLGLEVGSSSSTSSVTLVPPPDGYPPLEDAYDVTGSGSGTMKSTSYAGCPTACVVDWTDTLTWAGDMRHTGTLTVAPSVYPAYTVLKGSPGGVSSGTHTVGGTSEAKEYGDFQLLPDYGASGPTGEGEWDLIFIPTPAGQTSFSGTRTVDTPQSYGGNMHQVFSYSLHKTCSEGGTDC